VYRANRFEYYGDAIRSTAGKREKGEIDLITREEDERAFKKNIDTEKIIHYNSFTKYGKERAFHGKGGEIA
jgi:hypothetical protein